MLRYPSDYFKDFKIPNIPGPRPDMPASELKRLHFQVDFEFCIA